MSKQALLQDLANLRKSLENLAKEVSAGEGRQVQSRALTTRMQAVAGSWFDEVEPTLRSGFGIDEETMKRYHEQLTKLLEIAGGRPSRTVVLTILQALLANYHNDLVVAVQKTEAGRLRFPSLEAVLLHAVGPERGYLEEAVDCARSGRPRAAIIMAWSGAVNRLHMYIQRIGFGKFNEASASMAAVSTGRYKRFNKRFEIQNLSDLRMSVFDSDLLWVLEFMGAIDANQHERLETCYTMRNTAAHPGDAALSDENLLSFFSDIDTMVFANPKFEATPAHKDAPTQVVGTNPPA